MAAIQLVSKSDVNANLARAEHGLAAAQKRGAKLALLPENFACFNARGFLDLARQEEQDQALAAHLSAWAQRYALWIVAGTVPLLGPEAERVRAASLVFAPNGRQVARYDKIHLFDVDVADAQGAYRESDTLAPGQTPVVVELDNAQLGLSVCYDVRFPGLYQHLRDEGAELLTVPAAFTWVTGEAHWETLLRARAIETQCFVIAANQGGQHSSQRRTWGHSMIVDPWGRILAQAEEGEAVVVADCNLDELTALRQRMPVMTHRKAGISC